MTEQEERVAKAIKAVRDIEEEVEEANALPRSAVMHGQIVGECFSCGPNIQIDEASILADEIERLEVASKQCRCRRRLWAKGVST